MTKKLLKQLISYSYINNNLNEKNVLAIADKLDRKSLKQYINALKRSEKARSVYIDIPFTENGKNLTSLKTLYQDKKVIVRTDPSLLLGVRITDNDDVIELNLKNQLDSLINHIEE